MAEASGFRAISATRNVRFVITWCLGSAVWVTMFNSKCGVLGREVGFGVRYQGFEVWSFRARGLGSQGLESSGLARCRN